MAIRAKWEAEILRQFDLSKFYREMCCSDLGSWLGTEVAALDFAAVAQLVLKHAMRCAVFW